MTVVEKNQHTILRTINTLIWIFECWYILNHAQCIRSWIWWLGIHRAGRFVFWFRLTTTVIWNCIKITSWLRFTLTFRADWIESSSKLNPPIVVFNAMAAFENTCSFDIRVSANIHPCLFMNLFDQKLSSHIHQSYPLQKVRKSVYKRKSKENLPPQNLDREFHVRIGPLLYRVTKLYLIRYKAKDDGIKSPKPYRLIKNWKDTSAKEEEELNWHLLHKFLIQTLTLFIPLYMLPVQHC